MPRKPQLVLELRVTRRPGERRGGRRKGAGRKPNGARAGVSHLRRERVRPNEPQHVTIRIRRGLPSLRSKKAFVVIRRALAAAQDRMGLRIVHWSVQRDHLHLLVEPESQAAMARGMKGLQVRMARALNRLWGRKGSLFSDRYHCRALRTPREVRNALLYVLNNFRKHERQRGRILSSGFVDPLSTGPVFDGWTRRPCPVSAHGLGAFGQARSWLLRAGWLKFGRLSPAALPA